MLWFDAYNPCDLHSFCVLYDKLQYNALLQRPRQSQQSNEGQIWNHFGVQFAAHGWATISPMKHTRGLRFVVFGLTQADTTLIIQGLYLLSGRTSYRKISGSLVATRLDAIIPPHNEVVGWVGGGGGGMLVSLRPSVCPSIRPSIHPSVRLSRIPCPLCGAYISGWIHFVFTHLIKQLQKMCRV